MIDSKVSKKGSKLPNRTKIDETDAKILKTLFKESRTSFTEIAKDCGISVGAVRKRYKRLWKTGIINGAIMQVNPRSLGYKCIVTIVFITAREDESKVIEFLRSKPYTRVTFINYFERANMAAIISLHEFEELSGIMQEIEANPLIKHANAFIWGKTAGVDYSENLVLTPSINKNDKELHSKSNAINLGKAKIDETDRQIAKILSHNSRTPFTRIAEKLDISTKTVIQRYNKLRGAVLTLSTITVSLEKLGYNAAAHLFIKVKNKSKIPKISNRLLQIPNLITLIEFLGGECDLLSIVVLRDYQDLFKLKEQVIKIPDIEQIDIILQKPYDAWPLNVFASLL